MWTQGVKTGLFMDFVHCVSPSSLSAWRAS